jgi:serine/threonine protein kinase
MAGEIDLGLVGFEAASEIGRGGFGVVYKAWQPALQRWVAIKILHTVAPDEATRQQFMRELQLPARLSAHPNIVTVFGTGVDATGRPFIVMEWMAKGALVRSGVQTPRLPWQRVAEIGVKLSGALETIHRGGIIHHDVKPENILVSAFDEPELGDFGAAFARSLRTSERQDLHLTVAHAAPELLRGEEVTASVDTYALASTLHSLLRGMSPFLMTPTDPAALVLERIRTAAPPDLRPLGVPGALCAVLERGLAKTPGERQSSTAEFGEDIRRVQANSGLPPTQMVVPDAPLDDSAAAPPATVFLPTVISAETVLARPSGRGRPRARRRWMMIGAAVAALAAVAAGIVIVLARANSGHSRQSSVASATSPGSSHSATPTSTPTSSPSPTGLAAPVYVASLPAIAGDSPMPGIVHISGIIYQHGLSYDLHGISGGTVKTTFGIPPGATTFTTVIGNDDRQSNPLYTYFHLTYEVIVDGMDVVEGHAAGTTHDMIPPVTVTGRTQLELIITDPTVMCCSTVADWGDPEFH